MPTRHTQRNSRRVTRDESINTSGMASEAIEILMLALDLGWEAQVQKNGSMMLFIEHEGGTITQNLPTNSRNLQANKAKAWTRKILRYADPVKLALVTEAYTNWDSPDAATKASAEHILQGLRSNQIRRDPKQLAKIIGMEGGGTVEDWVEAEAERVEAAVNQVADEVSDMIDKALAEPEPPTPTDPVLAEPTPGDGEPTVVKVKPWIAKHQMRQEGGEVYPSRAVLERRWSDGSMDYLCAFEGCGYTSPDKPQSVAAHYGGKHGKERPATQNLAEAWIDPETRWTPTERQQGRIHRLEKEIIKAAQEIGWGDVTPRLLAEHIVKQRDAEREGLLDESTPLTDGQRIERALRILDGGKYADLIARVEQVEAECQARVAEAREQLGSKERGATNAIRTLEARLAEAQQAMTVTQQQSADELAEARRLAQEATDKWQTLVELVNQR